MDSANSARLERGRGSAEGRCRESRAWGRHRARSSVAPPTQDVLGGAMCVRFPNQKYHTRVKRSREEIPISWDGNRPTGEASIRELVESWVEAVRTGQKGRPHRPFHFETGSKNREADENVSRVSSVSDVSAVSL